MALDEDQIFQAFQIAGVIWDDFTNALIHDGFGVQLQVTDLDALQSALRSRLVALSSPAEAEVIDLITRWEQVKFSVAKMDQGSVGDTTGLKYDPQERKDTIKQLFSSTLGLMGIYQGQMQKKNAMYGNAADMGPIWVMRG